MCASYQARFNITQLVKLFERAGAPPSAGRGTMATLGPGVKAVGSAAVGRVSRPVLPHEDGPGGPSYRKEYGYTSFLPLALFD